MAHGTIVLAVSISIAIQAIMIDAANTDTLHAGESLKAGQQLTSGGGVAKLVVQGDGNLVLYQTNTGAQNDPVLWASNTHTSNSNGLHLDLQGDGNLVFYWDPGRVVWASNTSTATELVAQSDCNLVLRDGALNALWASNTGCRPAPGPAPGPSPGPAPGPPPPKALTITDFWNGDAHWELISKARFSEFGATAMNVGFDFVTRPNPAAAGGPPVWYLFHREYGFAPRPAYCVADYARVVVRKSTDKGVTWSDAHVIASPPPATGPANGTAAFADECAIVDGAGYFDERAGTWHYLVRHYSENCK